MKNLGWAVALLSLGACGKGGGPALTQTVKMDSPRATADGAMLAIKERNPKLGASLYVTDELLKKHLDCPDDAMAKRVAAKRATADKDFGEARDMVVEIGKFDKVGSDDRQLRAGDIFEGCKAKSIMKVHRSKLELRMTKEGKTEFDDESWTYVQLGDDPSWYWLP